MKNKKLNIINTYLDGLNIIEPNIYEDERGEFGRVFCEDELSYIFKENNIKQVNHSITHKKGSVRGLHFQYSPNCEIKLIKCIKGKIIDIVVDIRKDSITFLKSFSVELSAENKKMILIPKGFAHGFQTIEDDTELIYFHSEIYSPENEGAISIFDPKLDIIFPLKVSDISDKDKSHKYLDNYFKGIKI
ncbi:MAG: dTDP-4-dehydrorhamnose 3,5-epimerase family protein [Campylobacterota bacterium]|nr:dTDP-4-dehydrorhamnose 3,5-epimerase family protein [Campylobacterota bacterium]